MKGKVVGKELKNEPDYHRKLSNPDKFYCNVFPALTSWFPEFTLDFYSGHPKLALEKPGFLFLTDFWTHSISKEDLSFGQIKEQNFICTLPTGLATFTALKNFLLAAVVVH